MSSSLDLFQLPKHPQIITIPAVLGLIGATTYSDMSPFLKLRGALPAWFDKVAPILFYVHLAESGLAGVRSARAGRSAAETLKWMLATFVWGFGSLGVQSAQFRKLGR